MKKKLISLFIILVFCFTFVACVNSKNEKQVLKNKVEVQDFSGKSITFDKDIKGISSLHPIFSYMSWRLAPEKLKSVDMVFKSQYLKENSVKVFNDTDIEKLKSLPMTGVFFKGLNPEQLIKIAPDVIVTLNKDPNKDKLKEQIGIPILTLSKDTLQDYEKSFRILGKVLGTEIESNKLADYWNKIITETSNETNKIPNDKKSKVFYAGSGGVMKTVGKKTIMASIIDVAGGINVVKDINDKDTDENVDVSLEQIVSWDPNVIIVQNENQRKQIMSEKGWQSIDAVKNNRIYTQLKYAKTDGVSALMGVLWENYIINHPNDKSYEANLETRMKEFYSLFYKYDITNTQLKELQN